MKSLKLIAAAAVALAALACNKEQALPEEVAGGTETQTPQNGQSEEAGIPEGYVRLTFTTPADTKTALDKESGAVSWSENDQIKICWEGGFAISEEVVISDGIARFTANVSAAAEDLYAVYPSSITASVSDGSFNVDIPQKQTGRFADADIIVAKTTKTDLTFAFHHAVSLVRFVISEGNSRNITQAQFVDLANNSCLYGTLGITFSGTDIDKITEPTAEANDVIEIEEVHEGDNWIAVPPTKSLTGYGLRMGTSSAWLPGIVGEKAYAFSAAGKRLGLGTVDSKINDGDWYITPEGGASSQDGKSWETAYPADMLSSLIHNQRSSASGTKSLARGWRIDGKTIHVAEGTYDSGIICSFDGFTDGDDDVVSFTVKGGYSATGGAGGRAVIGSNDPESKESKRGFMFYTGAKATLDNISIINHSISAEGAAIRLDGGVNITINNCWIEGNVSTSNGGALYLRGTSSASLMGTTFKDNKGSNGGAIRVDEGSSLVLNRCDFEQNNASASGGALCLVGTTSISSCSFMSNVAGKHGGAIWAATNPINISECTFDSNRAADTEISGDGGAIYASVSIKADKCKFLTNNVAKGDSSNKNKNGTIRIGADSFFSSCEFRGNDTSYGTAGKVIYNATNSITAGFNNCLFYDNGSKANWTIFSAGPVIMVNSTMIDPSSGAELLRTTNTSSILYNNIVINTGTGSKAGIGNCAMKHDYNIVNSFNSTKKGTHDVTDVTSLGDGNAVEYDTFAAGKAAGVTTGMSYYYWNGTVSDFTQTGKAALETALSGTVFLTWLQSIGALDTDIRGVSRSNGYWPGCYQPD